MLGLIERSIHCMNPVGGGGGGGYRGLSRGNLNTVCSDVCSPDLGRATNNERNNVNDRKIYCIVLEILAEFV